MFIFSLFCYMLQLRKEWKNILYAAQWQSLYEENIHENKTVWNIKCATTNDLKTLRDAYCHLESFLLRNSAVENHMWWWLKLHC